MIGGGVSGLSVAWWLRRSGVEVELWESSGRAGGKIRTDPVGGFLCERAAAVLMNFRPEVVELLAASGLERLKQPRSAQAKHRYLVEQGRLVGMPMALPGILGSPIWSLRARLRLLLEPFVRRGGNADETVSEFVARRLGHEWLEKAFEPFVAGSLAADPDRANAWTTLPRLTALERRFGSIGIGVLVHKLAGRRTAMPAETFSFHGGMGALVRALATAPGLRVLTGQAATWIEPSAGGWRVTGESAQGERTVRARHVVLSAPAYAAAALLAPLDGEIGALLAGIEYAPLAVVHMGFGRGAIGHPLDGSGFLASRHAHLPMNGTLWMSALFPGRAPEGKALLTSYVGGARNPAALEQNDACIALGTQAALASLMSVRGEPELVRVQRHRRALPLYHGAYAARLAALDARLACLAGLHLSANYRGGVAVRDRLVDGRACAARIAAALGKRASAPEPAAFGAPQPAAA